MDVPKLDLPKSAGKTLQQLSSDHDSKIAFEALRSSALLERALLEQLLHAEAKDSKRIGETDDVLAEVIGKNNPNLPRYQPDNYRSDGRLIAVSEFTSRALLLIPRLGSPTHVDLEATKTTLEELCHGLNGQDFSPAAQRRLVNVLGDTCEAQLGSGSLLDSLPNETYHSVIISSTQRLASTLNDEFIELLRQRGFDL
ncbi:hypothetical protein BJV74DRAFT_861974 [Russula compacta]|nr:hypothetical protein BJV74DRAFT_861974 [Russula compacta]